MTSLRSAPHRRYNALNGEWILVSPQRLGRPWQGGVEPLQSKPRGAYDPNCYLCPGNARANGARNPRYEQPFVFDNDFPALNPGVAAAQEDAGGLLSARSEAGICRVVCFTPRHDLDIGTMTAGQVRAVVDAFADQSRALAADPAIGAVTIFENRGAMMGASNPHPHGQVWANASVPPELEKEDRCLRAYHDRSGTCLLCAYADLELQTGERVVYSDERLTIVVPYWASWPFETLVIPRVHAPTLEALDGVHRDALSTGMQQLASRYDRLFSTPFPYSMGFHQQPCGSGAHPQWHVHAHYFPPLLRSASVRKYMVGYEMLAQPQRDLTPEQAAARLRDL